MNFGTAPANCQKASEQTMTIIRLYGALILAQSWLVWQTRAVADPFVVCMHVCVHTCTCAYVYYVFMIIIRLYEALILAQSWLVWQAQAVADPLWYVCMSVCIHVYVRMYVMYL